MSTIYKNEYSFSCESPEHSSLPPNSVKQTITRTEQNKRKMMLIVDGYGFHLKNF